MTVFTILNYVAEQAKTTITEMNPITITRSTDEEHLLDSEFHLNAFKFRERGIPNLSSQKIEATH
ncbi:MAG: hypothetical protein U5K54_07835 [Cytophagales bacterium]|nr:hypothetical protein [Cytophagales bacterium]